MPVYPGDPAVEFAAHCSLDPDEYRVTALRLGTHAGTHLDAPAHYLEAGATVDRLRLEALVGRARVVDVSRCGRGEVIPAEALDAAARPGARLLLRTDWDREFGQPHYYEEFPGLAVEAAALLVERGVALLGLETPSLNAHNDAEVHRLLLKAGVVIVEGLVNLRELRSGEVWLAVLPLPLAGLDGSPCRAVAWEGDLT